MNTLIKKQGKRSYTPQSNTPKRKIDTHGSYDSKTYKAHAKTSRTSEQSQKDRRVGNDLNTDSLSFRSQNAQYRFSSRKKPVSTEAFASGTHVEQDKPAKHKRHNFAQRRKDPKINRVDKSDLSFKVIPLGGLDGIGKNMTVFECGEDLILDDAGLMFPDDAHPGVDLILPDYSYVLENAHRLRGIIVTHGHEDHTGSLPYLLKDLDRSVPIYTTKLTLGLIEGKLKEHKIKNAKLIEIKPGQKLKLGCVTANFFAVNHSIPDSVGVFFQSPAGTVLHTGDFKLDQTPIDGVHTDFGALSHFSKIGVDLLLSDSTNATNPNFTPSEAEVGKVLASIIAQAKGRVIVASFASHIHRMQQICDAAVKSGRKVVVTGRSMIQNTEIARRLGYLKISESDLIDAYDLKGLAPHQVVILCTGSQGEPLSALARIAQGDHKTIDIERGDTVIVSATPIPGNEKAVFRVLNNLTKRGVDVYDKSRARVHVSGHASAEELKLLLSIVQPKYFMPVHGESMHLRAHAALAEATGVKRDNIFLCENGETLVLHKGEVERGEDVVSGVVYVDGTSVGDTSERVLSERSSLGEGGCAVACALYNAQAKQIEGPIKISMKGISGGDDAELVRDIAFALKQFVSQEIKDKKPLPYELERIVRNKLLSLLWEYTKQRPLVIAQVLELP